MKPSEFFRQQTVSAPPKAIFAFFERPENLARLTPPWLDFVTLTPSPIPMHNGAVIDYTIRVLGRRWRWTTIINDYDPPRRFVDQQLIGPYNYWRHAHTFEQAAGGGSVITDRVLYIPRPSLWGLTDRLYVRRSLNQIFDYRAERIRESFGG